MELSEANGSGAPSGVPPYISFKTLQTFLKDLKENDIPNKVDRSVLSRFSGSVGTQLMTAIRWLDLVDEEMRPKPTLKNMVESFETPSWPATLQKVLKDRYKFVLDLDLTKATPNEFVDAFRQFNAKDDVLAKSKRFFLQAADSAGIEVNARLKQRAKPARSTTPRQKKSHAVDKRQHEAVDEPPAQSPTLMQKSDYDVLIELLDPNEMNEEEENAVWTLIRYLKKREADQ